MTDTSAARTIYQLSTLGLGLAVEDGIIPRDALEGIDAAGLIVERAQRQAEELREEARHAFAAEKTRGLAEGLAAAEEQAAARLLSEHALLDRTMIALESDLADLVLDVMRKLILTYDREALVTEFVRSALATMRSEKRVQLHLPPSTLESVRSALGGFMEDYPEIELIDIIPDGTLEPPNLRLESTLGVVNFVLDDTVAGLERLLRDAQTKGDG